MRVSTTMGQGLGAGRVGGVVVAAALAVAGGGRAQAQTPSPLAEWQFSSGQQLQRLFEPTVPTWQVEAGIGGQFAPTFDGGGRYHIQPGPVFDVRYKDIAFASTGDGVGANLFSFRHISFGGSISYDLGRSPHIDGQNLSGLGTIHPAPELKIFATTVVSESFPLTVRLDIRKQLGATDGWIGDVGAYLPMPGSSQTFAWFVGPTVTMADERYMQGYFGVSKTQAASTRYHRFTAYGGFKSAGLGFSAIYFATPHVLFVMSDAFDRLLGSASESPITQEKYEAVVSLSALYKF